ncbi:MULTISPECIES: signal peptidase I [Streptomyces]|uniref:signal peptidase I n=2 Tax=Streptomyces TaxID=1883 RepID=UPI000851DAAA|nr:MULTISPECIES: signal peptidase I [unclassified Streptomyces]
MSGTGSKEDGRGRLGAMLSGLAVAVGCVLFLGGFAWAAVVYQPYTIPTDSMAPTVNPGDRVLAERIDGADVRRGDVVVFTDEVWAATPMVKRVVGVGGDEVACCDKDGRLTVNGTPVDEPYVDQGPTAAGGKAPASPQEFSATVPRGKIFLLGDERATSLDSRVHLQEAGQGSVPLSAVQARVDAVAWPMDGMIDRPSSFAALPGGVSAAGPLPFQLGAILVGAALILGGAVYGPVAARLGRRKTSARGAR